MWWGANSLSWEANPPYFSFNQPPRARHCWFSLFFWIAAELLLQPNLCVWDPSSSGCGCCSSSSCSSKGMLGGKGLLRALSMRKTHHSIKNTLMSIGNGFIPPWTRKYKATSICILYPPPQFGRQFFTCKYVGIMVLLGWIKETVQCLNLVNHERVVFTSALFPGMFKQKQRWGDIGWKENEFIFSLSAIFLRWVRELLVSVLESFPVFVLE